jgi:hypothetical protein
MRAHHRLAGGDLYAHPNPAVVMPEQFCAQIRCDGRGWITVGSSRTRAEAARQAAKAYAAAPAEGVPRPVQVRVIHEPASGPAKFGLET